MTTCELMLPVSGTESEDQKSASMEHIDFVHFTYSIQVKMIA